MNRRRNMNYGFDFLTQSGRGGQGGNFGGNSGVYSSRRQQQGGNNNFQGPRARRMNNNMNFGSRRMNNNMSGGRPMGRSLRPRPLPRRGPRMIVLDKTRNFKNNNQGMAPRRGGRLGGPLRGRRRLGGANRTPQVKVVYVQKRQERRQTRGKQQSRVQTRGQSRGGKSQLNVSNLDPSTNNEDLKNHFITYGKLKRCAVIYDKEGNSTTVAKVQYTSHLSAQKATSDLNSKYFIGYY